MHYLSSIEDWKLQTNHERVRRILRQNPQRGSAVVGDLHRKPRLDKDVVVPHTVSPVAHGEKHLRRFRNAVRIEFRHVLLIDARRVRPRRFAALELGVRNYFVRRRVTFRDVPECVVVERVQRAGAERGGADLVRELPGRDHSPHFGCDLEELDERKAPGVPAEAALRASGCLDVPSLVEQTHLRRADHGVELFDWRFIAAVRARSPHETLGRDTDQAGRDSEGLHPDVRQSRNRAYGVVGVQRRQHEVARHRRLERDRRCLLISDFSHQEHVGILTQHRSQHTRESKALLLVHLHLIDAAQPILYRVFDGDDVDRLAASSIESGV